MIADSKQFNQVLLNMADGVDIDLYADVDQEFNQVKFELHDLVLIYKKRMHSFVRRLLQIL